MKRFLNSFGKHYIFWTFLLTVLVTLLQMLFFALEGNGFFYVDTDCYMRALRITDWLQNFSWDEKIFPYTNPPDGFVLHFTRICDVIWLIFSLPFMPFMHLKEAVFYGGFCFSPFFMFLTLCSVLWGIKPYSANRAHKEELLVSVLVFSAVFCCKLIDEFDFYRPDHHSLMCFVFTFGIAAVLRSYLLQNKRELFAAGVLAGLGLWASSAPEGLYAAGVVLFVLTAEAVFDGRTQKPLFYSLGLFYAVLAAWLINPPYGGYRVTDNLRLSVIHVTLCGFMLLSYAVWHCGSFKSRTGRALIISAAAIISSGLLLILFGAKTVFAPVYEPHVYKYFVSSISEMMNIFVVNSGFLLLPVLAGALIIPFLFRRKKVFLCLGILYLFTSLPGTLVSRFYIYYLPVWLFIYAFGLDCFMQKKEEGIKYKIAAFVYVVWPVFYLASFTSCPAQIVNPRTLGISGTVLAHVTYAPQLVWYKNVDTVGSPYHTNVEGIIDNHIMWFTPDEGELKTLLKKRGVTYVTLYGIKSFDYYPDPENNTDKLYGKVLTGKDLYPWLEETDKYTYRVNYEKF